MLTIFRLVDVCHLHRSSNSIGGIDNNVALDHPIVIFVKDYFSYSNIFMFNDLLPIIFDDIMM